jgi:crotonobetainyl-CoA:carnitine CoA-transferase CaiB-like acyl-CoA transferase
MLEGIRVLDFTHTLAGLYCSMHLVDLGAEVIQVEPTIMGSKGIGSRTPSGWQANGFDMRFLTLCRNKNSILINLKDTAAKEVFHDLVKKSDVVVDNLRPEATKRLGIDYEILKEVNPKIISCSITGYNRSGRYRDLPGFDYVAQALSGFWNLTGEDGRSPVVPAIPLIDATTGMFAVKGILAALYHRAMHDEGQKVDVSLLSTALSLTLYDGVTYMNSGIVPGPQGTKMRSFPLFGVFQTKDSYIALCLVTDQQFKSMCHALEADHLFHDERFHTRQKRVENRQLLDDLTQEILLQRETAPLIKAFADADVPAEQIIGLDKALVDPRVLEEGIIGSLNWKKKRFKIFKSPIRLSAKKDIVYSAPPDPGNNTDEIVSKLLGYSIDKINQLKEKGIIA